jgi:hypothetical protein
MDEGRVVQDSIHEFFTVVVILLKDEFGTGYALVKGLSVED